MSLRVASAVGACAVLILAIPSPPVARAVSVAQDVAVQLRDTRTVLTIRVPAAMPIEPFLRDLEADPAVLRAERSVEYHAVGMPNDPLAQQQPHLEHVRAPQAWDTEHGSRAVIIAVLDSGLDTNHPDLAKNLWTNTAETVNGRDDDRNGYVDDVHGYDFVDEDGDPNPSFDDPYVDDALNHGTVVAGVAAARGNNGIGVTGITWRSRIMPLRVLNGMGSGNTATIARALAYAADHGADIVVMSFVGSGRSTILESALQQAHDDGVLLVAAAGNDGVDLDQSKRYPVCADGSENIVLGVGATTLTDVKTSWSNYGGCVDIVAPGTSIRSTVVHSPKNGFSNAYAAGWQGTSFSAPIVAGVAALARSANPALDNDALRDLLVDTAADIRSLNPSFRNDLGGGRVDAEASVHSAVVRASADAPRIVTGAGPGAQPLVGVFDRFGHAAGTFSPYGATFTGGVSVATGDVDGDGESEIITGTGPGGGPHVRVFSRSGALESQFFAYGENVRTGVTVAAGDLNGDGKAEIITGTGPGAAPHVRTFDRYGAGIFTPGFYAYGENVRTGVTVAVGDLNGDGKAEIITGTGPGGGPHVRTFDRYGAAIFTPGFFAYDTGFHGGVSVAGGP